MNQVKTTIELAFEKAEAAKKELAREKHVMDHFKQWREETKDPRYNESVETWMNHMIDKSHDNG